MRKISLLDCTLRDGGYVNDWEFGRNNLISIFERLTEAGVDIIEVGFLDDRRPFDKNRSMMPDTSSAAKMWGEITKKPDMVVGMIDYGTCSLKNIQPCGESFLDGIRVIFKKHIMREALEYCAQIKALGYRVFVQLVSITSYSEEDLSVLAALVNQIKPYAVSMVDTYGLLTPDKLLYYYAFLDEHVLPGIRIGFHAHNNFQLGFANAIAFMEKKTQREIVVDATLYGMGKSAGNAPIELVAGYMNRAFQTSYHIAPLLEAITESVLDFYAKNPWGYQLFYYLSAANACHPNYVSALYDKDNLSVSKIYSVLGCIEPEEKKLLYDKAAAEAVYEQFAARQLDSKEVLHNIAEALSGKPLLLAGPGKNIKLQAELIDEFIRQEAPAVISVNYLPADFEVDYVFVTKRNRYLELAEALCGERYRRLKIIATSNIESRGRDFDYVVDRASLLDRKGTIQDNSFLMLLRLMTQAGIKKVTCAGFDGYSAKDDNYFNPKMEYAFVKEEAYRLNAYVRDVLGSDFQKLDIQFLTYSHYVEEENCYSGTF